LVLLVEDVVADELCLIFSVYHFIRFAFGERVIDIFDGFEVDRVGVFGEIEEEFLCLDVHELRYYWLYKGAVEVVQQFVVVLGLFLLLLHLGMKLLP
jgi:hypothetical protein